MTQRKTNIFQKKLNRILSIQVNLNGLSFCVIDVLNNSIEYIDFVNFKETITPNNLTSHIDNWFKEHPDTSYDRVIVIHQNELAALVPEPMFQEDCLSDYLKYNIKILEGDFITYDKLISNNAYNVYIPFTNVNNYIFEKFGDFVFKHSSTILIDRLASYKNNNVPTLYVNINDKHFEVVVLNQEKLILYNYFIYNEKEDFLYYLLFIFEQLKLDTKKTPVKLLGSINETDELYLLVYKYIQHLEIKDDLLPEQINCQTLTVKEKQQSILLLNSL